MNTLKYQKRYRRKLPHIQPPGATFFISFRLADSIPQEVWVEMRKRLDALYLEMGDEFLDHQALALEHERLWFQEYEQYLHDTKSGPFWLKDDRIAGLVAEDFHHFDGQRYQLDSFCVMPNHVHVVLMPLPTTVEGKEAHLNNRLVMDREGNFGYFVENEQGMKQFIAITFHSLASIMHSIKRHSAYEANLLLGRRGSFWEDESYDHYIRDNKEWQRTIRYVLNNPVKAGIVTDWKDWQWSWQREEG